MVYDGGDFVHGHTYIDGEDTQKKIRKREKPDLNRSGFKMRDKKRNLSAHTQKMSVSLFERSDASRANVAVGFLAVFHVGNLLNVYFESSSRFTVGVADVVAGRLTLTANIAYSGHIDTSDFGIILP